MTIEISPDLEKMLEEKVAKGEFPTRESVVEAELRSLLYASPETAPSSHSFQDWDKLMAEVDSDEQPESPPLSDEALSRETIYEDHRHRL